MRDCLEYIGEIIAVHPIPLGTLSFAFPFNVQRSSVSASEVSLNGRILTRSAVKALPCLALESYDYNNVRANMIIAQPGITAKESSKVSAAGVSYETKVSVRSYADINELRELVNDVMEAPAFDVLLVDSFDNIFLLRGVEPATNIALSANLPITTLSNVEVQVVSVNGILPIAF